jgi:hypothetical protein
MSGPSGYNALPGRTHFVGVPVVGAWMGLIYTQPFGRQPAVEILFDAYFPDLRANYRTC